MIGLDFNKKTYVMGIINVTPDSFSGDGVLDTSIKGQEANVTRICLQKAQSFIQKGADILDIGGESTRPGAHLLSIEAELSRVIPVITAIRNHTDILISIDTTKAEVAREALKSGANIVNDVSGLMMHTQMIDVVRDHSAYVIIMHSYHHTTIDQRDLGGAHQSHRPELIVQEIMHDLEKLAIYAISHGISKHKIILDPGIGYGKTAAQNMMLLKHISKFKELGYPILVGASRKSFIGYVSHASVKHRLGGSLAANVIAVLGGASIVRAHDIAETVQAIQVTQSIMEL